MAFYVTVDSRCCQWSNGVLTVRLATPLYLSGGGGSWQIALWDYTIHPTTPVPRFRPLYILCDLVEPQLVNKTQQRLLHVGPIDREKRIINPQFKQISVPQVDTITLKFVDSTFQPVQFPKHHILLNLAFRKL